MSKKENVLTGYCFLAALTENRNDLFNQVYIPICKRALSLYSLKVSTHGKAEDIQEIIRNEYGIEVPQLVVKRLINATFKSLSNRARKKYEFKVFQNGEQFEIEKYLFNDLEIQYKKGHRNARSLQLAFEAYLTSEDIDIERTPSFGEFLSKNKRHLAAFFKSSSEINGDNIDVTYIHHVQFLEYVDTSNNDLFEIAKGLYLGSIVASFLESGIDLEPKFESNEIYYLDTPIVLRALDLQKEEETKPIKELLSLIESTGGKLKILSITIEEIYRVIENSIGNYNNTTPTSTINEACLRLGKNRAWLMTYNGNLEKNILEALKVEKEEVKTSFIEKNQNTADVKALQEKRIRKGNALHDVLAYLFVREKRGGSVSLFQKAKAWFLTNNTELLKFNRQINPSKGITEIALPDALTGLLWLKDPNKLIDRIKNIGLAELMATTLNEEIASKEIINEFETNIKSIEDISDSDYRILLESVAHQSAKRIEDFNEIAFKDKEKAKVEAHKIVEWERSRKAKRIKAIKDAQASKADEENRSKELQNRLAQIESELKTAKNQTDTSKTQIEELSEKVSRQERRLRRIIWSLIIGLILGVIGFIGFYNFDILHILGKVFSFILSAGALFSLGTFILNLMRFFKGK